MYERKGKKGKESISISDFFLGLDICMYEEREVLNLFVYGLYEKGRGKFLGLGI